ncbi:PLD nuclease N-terminal domain-containing protein [Dictyobacter arantiisoli]
MKTNERVSELDQKVLWLLFILFSHIIGAILYALIGRPKKQTP